MDITTLWNWSDRKKRQEILEDMETSEPKTPLPPFLVGIGIFLKVLLWVLMAPIRVLILVLKLSWRPFGALRYYLARRKALGKKVRVPDCEEHSHTYVSNREPGVEVNACCYWTGEGFTVDEDGNPQRIHHLEIRKSFWRTVSDIVDRIIHPPEEKFLAQFFILLGIVGLGLLTVIVLTNL